MLQLRFPFSPRVNRDTEYVLTFDSVNKKNKWHHFLQLTSVKYKMFVFQYLIK